MNGDERGKTQPVTEPEQVDLRSLYPEELSELLSSLGEPAFRGVQVFGWLHRRGATSFQEMSDVPKPLRARLEQAAVLYPLELTKEVRAADGTTKGAFRLSDGHVVESVLIPHRKPASGGQTSQRNTVCVSSEAGCAFGCKLCASGAQGLARSLTAGEIVAQVYYFERKLAKARIEPQAGHCVTNVVFMGSGEPLANYQAVLRAVRLLNHPEGLGIAARHIAISTCGLPEGIRRLAKEDVQLSLAVSLHAADDDTRSKLMPVNRKYPVAAVMEACRDYFTATKRKVTFEYALIPGVNASLAQMQQLAALVKGLPCVVNLIPANPTEGIERAPTAAEIGLARAELEKRHIEVAVRRSRGREIIGACGQLAGKTRQPRRHGGSL